jgi:hypothetical protein
VIGGLSFSTILTLIVIPGAYVLLNHGGTRLRGWLTRSPSEPEPGVQAGPRRDREPALDPVARTREEPA